MRLLCAGYGASTTAVSVSADMHTGVVDRFRSLPITSPAVLTGHVVASMAKNVFSTLVVIGLVARRVEAASAFTFFVLFLPYVSSAFVPPETMPAVLRGFADNQPVTPMIETIRGFLMGTPVGDSVWTAVAWFGRNRGAVVRRVDVPVQAEPGTLNRLVMGARSPTDRPR